jgi:pimeloyl-ACP methyl ester carboxylesterase
MDRFEVDDVELRYDRRGGGERVVFVHASAFVSWYEPLVERLPDHSTLTYQRHLRTPSGTAHRPLTVAEDALTCARLIDHVGWPTAHIVGHSYGALVALQLAMDRPERVASVVLLEPAARGISSSEQVLAALRPVMAAYRAGDTAEAIDRFLRHVCGDGYRAVLDRVLPGAFAEALAEADLFFQAEMPAVQSWAFGTQDAARVDAPVLNVRGADSVPRFVEGAELVQTWFPEAGRLVVPGAGHLLMVQNPAPLAEGVSAFIARHPIAAAESASDRRRL